MKSPEPISQDLVSVIITCYNHGKFLAQAIESVLQQQYNPVEVIVVDDGSTDNTKQVAAKFPQVKYIYQSNQGLSAARNTGVKVSSGEYLLFLDADDWLLPGALETNTKIIQENVSAAFVSGGHTQYLAAYNKMDPQTNPVEKEHYLRLLEKNYIAMHATVLYRTKVFEEFCFDTSLNACEDYDLYLSIARKYPIYHHQNKIAVYRIYGESMSGNGYRMLTAALRVMEKHKKFCVTDEEKAAWQRGVNFWTEYYGRELYSQLCHRLKLAGKFAERKEWDILKRTNRKRFLKLKIKTNIFQVKKILKQIVPVFAKRFAHKAGLKKNFTPPPGKVNAGDLHRLKPLSTEFGFDRGGAVDRHYIEKFLQQHAHVIKGRVLEIGDDYYTQKFGGANVSQPDVLHVDDSNKRATFIGDLTNAPQIPSNSFDCIILTQTLHLLYDVKSALHTCYRILKPGGTLLLTVPGITHIDHGEWKHTWYWAFTDKSIKRLLNEVFTEKPAMVQTHGNVYIATAFLYGLGLPEVSEKDLNHHDEHYQVIIAASAEK